MLRCDQECTQKQKALTLPYFNSEFRHTKQTLTKETLTNTRGNMHATQTYVNCTSKKQNPQMSHDMENQDAKSCTIARRYTHWSACSMQEKLENTHTHTHTHEWLNARGWASPFMEIDANDKSTARRMILECTLHCTALHRTLQTDHKLFRTILHNKTCSYGNSSSRVFQIFYWRLHQTGSP